MSARRVALVLAALAGPAAAHDRTTSYSSWEIRGREARVTVRVATLDASRFPWGADPTALGAYLEQIKFANCKINRGYLKALGLK